MENDKVIVAIELGSSKISGVAGQIMTDGSLKVLAYASVPSSSCIKHGAVYNLTQTANAIAEVIGRLIMIQQFVLFWILQYSDPVPICQPAIK